MHGHWIAVGIEPHVTPELAAESKRRATRARQDDADIATLRLMPKSGKAREANRETAGAPLKPARPAAFRRFARCHCGAGFALSVSATGQGAAVVGRLMVQAVYPSSGNAQVRLGTCAWCWEET